MKVIRLNSTEPDVRKWQIFLAVTGHQQIVDFKFGQGIDCAIKQFSQA